MTGQNSDPLVVSIGLQKGGVGKTTFAINLAERLAALGNRTCFVDLDQQGNATEGVGHKDAMTTDRNLNAALRDDEDVSVRDVIRTVDCENTFDLIPAHKDFNELENWLDDHTWGQLQIRNQVVDELSDDYDAIVIDTPPNLGLMSDSGHIASQAVVVPLLMSAFSEAGFERMFLEQIVEIDREIGCDIYAIVPNKLSGDNEEKRIINDMEDSPFGQYLPEFCRSKQFDRSDSPGPGIRKNIGLKRSIRDGVPLADYDPENPMIERFEELARIVETGGLGGPVSEVVDELLETRETTA